MMSARSPRVFVPSPLSDGDFRKFQSLIEGETGIHLNAAKKPLLCGRLSSRLRDRGLHSFSDYSDLVTSGRDENELQRCIDQLTTNETSFFREYRHFEILEREVLPPLRRRGNVRLWSAACSSGQEPWSLAMTAADVLGDSNWEVLGSDISSRMLEKAHAAHYPIEQAERIPAARRLAHCLKGIGNRAGTFTVSQEIRSHVRLARINLNKPLPVLGRFDAIFLRNVLIYFERAMQHVVVTRLLQHLKSDGWLFIGHSENLNGVAENIVAVAPTVYRLRK